MPLYNYKCSSCEHTFNRKLKISERAIPISEDCPSCNSIGHISQVIGTPLVSYSTNPGMKVSDNFTDRLNEIKKTKGEGCTIETKR